MIFTFLKIFIIVLRGQRPKDDKDRLPLKNYMTLATLINNDADSNNGITLVAVTGRIL